MFLEDIIMLLFLEKRCFVNDIGFNFCNLVKIYVEYFIYLFNVRLKNSGLFEIEINDIY